MNKRCPLMMIGLLLLVTTVSALSGNWTEVNASAEFPERYQHSSVVYGGSMWVIGGNNGGYLNDTWYSPDGNLWYRANYSAEFPARNAHASVVHNNRIWVIGGLSDGNLKNDSWYSTDGAVWIEATPGAAFPKRLGHTAVVYDNKMWVIGGSTGGALLNDSWFSSDGVTWTLATTGAAFPARQSHTSVVYDNKMWVIGGDSGADKNDTWFSSDGVTWTPATAGAAFPARYFHTSVVYDYKLWVLGGLSSVDGILNDAWYSSDGITWTQASVALAAPSREGHTSLVSGSKMWIFGGFNGANKNDTWSFQSSPVAGFAASPTSGDAPLSVTFSDTSTGYPSSYSWDFGDGGTALIANPVHAYPAAGTYTVSHTVTNSDGTSTETKAQYITVTTPVSSGNSGNDPFPSGSFETPASMTTDVNVGGNSAVTQMTVSGTGLSDLIITGLERSVPGTGIPPPPGIVYQYIDLIPARYSAITGSEILFSVLVPWLEEHHVSPGNVITYHYTGTAWEVLPTKILNTEDDRVYFSAKGSGLSLFAISGKPDDSQNAPYTDASPNASDNILNPEKTPDATSPVFTLTTAPLPVPPVLPGSGLPLTIVLTAIGCAGLVTGGVLVRRWWIRRQNPALFRDYE